MNILLDTHVALWAITDSPRLPQATKALIQAERTIVWISTVSLWEIAIKHGLGRGDMPISGQEAFDYFQQSGYRFLSIEPEHALAVASLPAHHQDPFDRLLIAQAMPPTPTPPPQGGRGLNGTYIGRFNCGHMGAVH